MSEVWRVGFLLENGLERGEIERTIRRLMAEEEGLGQEMRRRATHLKEYLIFLWRFFRLASWP